jgi:hypothetical protein
MAKFDVFLAHNSLDKPLVRIIFFNLQNRGFNPFLDEEEIQPGRLFQDVIQEAIRQSKCVAVFIGKTGLGNWQAVELKTFISQCVNRGIPVIPVLLPGVQQIPQNLLFLQEFHSVRFRQDIDDYTLNQLIWGITGQKSGETSTKTTDQIDPKPYEKPPDRRKFLKWAGLGTLSLVTAVAGTEIWERVKPKSEKGIDYKKLRDLLAAGKWKEADEETYRVMIKAVGKEYGDSFKTSDTELLNFPCTDLRTIDQLWLEHSNKHFGLSVQKKIYLEAGGKADGNYDEEAWKKYGDMVKWRENNIWIGNVSNVTFDIHAAEGHLPYRLWSYDGGQVERWVGGNLFFSMKICNL